MKKCLLLVLVCAFAAPRIARAQAGSELTVAPPRPITLGVLPVRYTFGTGTMQTIVLPAIDGRLVRAVNGEPSPTRRLERPNALVPLYASMATLQGLDAVSTWKALAAGGREANPLVAPLVGSPAMLLALKAGVTGSMIYASERLWRQNRKAAVLLLVGTNVGYAVVVSHNLALAARAR
jgi:hypothetical protein